MAQSKTQHEADVAQATPVVAAPVEQVGDQGVVAPKSLKNADAVSGPGISDAELEDAPVRTGRPDVPVAVTLATGAGAHTPPDPDKVGPDGRPTGLPGAA